MVAVQLRRFSGEEGKAETPGEGESISCRSSVWRLAGCQCHVLSGFGGNLNVKNTYRLVTLWAS